MESTGLKKLKQLLLDSEFYRRRGHAVIACFSVLWLTVMYIAGKPVNLSIYADTVIMAGLLVILPKVKLNGVESSNKLARNIFGYTFLLIIVFVALGDTHGFLSLPGDSKAEFFTILSHVCMVLFGASKVEISRNAIESVKDAFNWRRGYGTMVNSYYDDHSLDVESTEDATEKKDNEQKLKAKVQQLRTPANRNNLLGAMQSYRGMCEVEGAGSNKTLLALAKKAGFSWYTDDSIPWCAVMMNICCMIAGLPMTKSARAKDFLKWGKAVSLEEARQNIGKVIAVFHRGETTRDSAGHVTVVESIAPDGKSIVGIGGNQSDCVMSSRMPIDNWRFIGFRVP